VIPFFNRDLVRFFNPSNIIGLFLHVLFHYPKGLFSPFPHGTLRYWSDKILYRAKWITPIFTTLMRLLLNVQKLTTTGLHLVSCAKSHFVVCFAPPKEVHDRAKLWFEPGFSQFTRRVLWESRLLYAPLPTKIFQFRRFLRDKPCYKVYFWRNTTISASFQLL